MSDDISPAVRALFAAADAPDKEVPCLRCGQIFMLQGFIWESVKLWNREENESAARAGAKPNFIRSSEIACCDACFPLEKADREVEAQRQRALTEIYLRDLRAGRYSPDTLQWLRDNGHAAEVWRILNEEGK